MTTRAQQAFILFPNQHTLLQDLTAELERRLASQGVTILSYGTSPRRNEGFVVVEAAQGIPDVVVQWLSACPEIKEYVVCNVPSIEQERQAEEEANWAAKAEIVTIIRAVEQELPLLRGEASPTDIQTVKSAFQRVSTAQMREEAARHSVTRACNALARDTGQGDSYFQSLLWVDDACGAAIKELFLVAIMWRSIGRDLLESECLSGDAIEHQCLLQSRRVTRLALSFMDKQLEASGMTEARLQETITLEQEDQL